MGFDRQIVDSETPGTGYFRVCALASGGLGEVEVAQRVQGRFRRLYAVKRLKSGYREDDDLRAMFVEEARLAGLIRHPNVVSVLDVGEDAEGPFLVMDYVDGVPASALVRSVGEGGRLLPLQVCLRVAIDVCAGLHAAHELRDEAGRPLNLVHRDVSPQNILVGFDGVTRVTDFGVAKAFGRTTQTATGVLKGKFGYMAPEQLRFEEPDRRADLFALGVVLFELLTGERLYRNISGMDGVRRILHEPPPDVGEHREDAPPELVALLFALLAKDPAHRPADALEVARQLELVLQKATAEEGRLELDAFLQRSFREEREARAKEIRHGLGVSTERPPAPAVPPLARRRTVALALAVVTVLLAAAAGAWWHEVRSANARGQAPPAVPDIASDNREEFRSGATGSAEEDEQAPAPTARADEQGTSEEAAAATPREAVNEQAAPNERSARPKRQRRPRRPAAKRPRSGGQGDETASGVPQWDWQ